MRRSLHAIRTHATPRKKSIVPTICPLPTRSWDRAMKQAAVGYGLTPTPRLTCVNLASRA
jgi:hypothetical protein